MTPEATAEATVVGIATDLGLMDGTLSAWLKAARVGVHQLSGGRSEPPPPDVETPEQERSFRLRASLRAGG